MLDKEMTDEEKHVANMEKALEIIHDKAAQLCLVDNLPPEVEEGLGLIIALARYQHDIRSIQEKEKMKEAGSEV